MVLPEDGVTNPETCRR